MLGRVDEAEAMAVTGVEALPPPVIAVVVGVEVVPDDVDALSRIATRDLVHERDERVGTAVRNDLSVTFSRADIEGGQQRLRPVGACTRTHSGPRRRAG